MQVKDYVDVVSGVEALAGTALETAEKNRLAYLINQRAQRAYEAFDYWPRWLVVGEFRHVDGNKVVPDTISGENTIDTFLRVHEYDPFDLKGSNEWDFNTVEGGARLVNYSYGYNSTALTFTSLLDAGTGIFIAGTSEALGLAVGDKINIAGVVEVDGVDSPNGEKTLLSISGVSISFASSTTTFTNYASNIADATIKSPKVYTTYKKALDVTYGDGVADTSNTTQVPMEWFGYLVHGTYADFLRTEGQTEKALVEDNEANKILSEQIERADNSQTNPALATRIESHGTSQSRSAAI